MLQLRVYVTEDVVRMEGTELAATMGSRAKAGAGGSEQNLELNKFTPNYISNFSFTKPKAPKPLSAANIAQITASGRVIIGENNEENNEENNNTNPESVQEGGVLHNTRKTRRTRRQRPRLHRKNRPLRKNAAE